MSASPSLKVCFFGTYDADQPRTRVMIEGLRQTGVAVLECRAALWANTAHKVSVAQHPDALVRQSGRLVRTYRQLLGQARQVSPCDAVIYPHFGQLDLIVTGWVFRRRGIPVIWDALVSAFDTAVEDRRLLDKRSVWARGLAWVDRLAGQAADLVLADTPQNAAFWHERFGVPASRLRVVPVGAEDMFVQATPGSGPDDRFEVLFFGKYTPLHGVETIVQAAKLLEPHSHIRVTMLGTGQLRSEADALAAELDLTGFRFLDWVPYVELPAAIAAADICLGIFGTGGKAGRVVPNKAYQAIAAGRPLITADTPAARTGLLRDGLTGAVLVPPGDADALASAILEISQKTERRMAAAHDGHELYLRHYRSGLIGEQVAGIIRDMRPCQSEPRSRVGR